MKTGSMALLALCLMNFAGMALAQGGATMEEQGSTSMKKMDKGAMEKPMAGAPAMEKKAMTATTKGKSAMKPKTHGKKPEMMNENKTTPGAMQPTQ